MNEFVIKQNEAALEVPLPLIIKQRYPFLLARKTMGGPSMRLESMKQFLVLRKEEEEAPALKQRAQHSKTKCVKTVEPFELFLEKSKRIGQACLSCQV